MSKYLGPIHNWLYEKIKLQDNFNEYIISSISNDELTNKVHLKYSALSTKELVDQINTENIHAWLQEKVDYVEYKFAYIISIVINENITNIDKLKNIAFQFGKNLTLNNSSSSKDIYNSLNDLLLDGMPCDNVNTILSEDKSELLLRQNINIHSKYFNSFSLDIEVYNIIRLKLIEGILSNTDYLFNIISDDIFEIKKR